MAAPCRRNVLSLYKNLLCESKKLSDYNFKTYAGRRIRHAFKENKDISDQSKIQNLISKAEENLGVLRRQAMIGQLFASESKKVVIETQANDIMPER